LSGLKIFFLSAIFLLVVISFSVDSESSLDVISNYSVDSIAVYAKDTGGDQDIYYSIYGHNPKIPKPVDTPLIWKWWTLDGENVASAQIPNLLTGNNSRPSIAFSREGFAVAVWDNVKQVGTVPCGNPPYPNPVYQGDILFSVWNGTGWSNAAVAAAGADDVHLIDPSIAIDNNGNGIVTYTKEFTQRDQGCPNLVPIVSVEYVKFKGSDKTFPVGGVLEPPYTDPQMYHYDLPTSEVAFTSRLLNPGLFTRQEAVAVWWAKDTEYSKTCPGNPDPIKIQTYWPKYGIWNGTGFDKKDFIPNKLVPPADLSDNLSVLMGGKLGISSDQFNHAEPVWIVQKLLGDPCILTINRWQVWSARWNSTDWAPKAAAFKSSGPMETYFGVDISYLQNNEAISVYDKTIPGGSSIDWSLGLDNPTTWINKNQVDSSEGGSPTIASLAHNITVAIWENVGNIMWTKINSDATSTGLWDNSAILAPGMGQPDIAAHTGSPTMPHAEWTFAAYQAADNNLEASIATADFNEMKTIGSTNLINVVTQTDRQSTNSVIQFYVKENAAAQLGVLGSTNMSNPDVLANFVAFVSETYPSKRAFLDLEDHGGGWTGCNQDVNSGNSLMGVLDLQKGIKEPNKFIDILGYDECLMANIETVYQLRNEKIAYWLASEETEGGPGWNYNLLLSNITLDPHRTTSRLAIDSVDRIFAGGGTSTFSAVDMSKTPNLFNSINGFSNAIINNFSSNKTIKKLLESSAVYWRPTANIFRDIGDFSNKSRLSLELDPNIKNAAAQVLNDVQNAVVAEKHTAAYGNSTGIQIFYHMRKITYLNYQGYNQTDFFKNLNWINVIFPIASSTGIIAKLSADSPLLSLTLNTSLGTIGYTPQVEDRCNVVCKINGIQDAQCIESDNGNTILILNDLSEFNYTIDGSLLLVPQTNFNLSIGKFVDSEVMYIENISGTINKNEVIFGSYPKVKDNNAPIINLFSPLNGTIETSSSIIHFSYNVSDLTSGISSCKLIVDNNVVQTDTTITENIQQDFNQVLNNGIHNWKISCKDNSINQNQGFSETRTLNVNVPINNQTNNLTTLTKAYLTDPRSGTVIVLNLENNSIIKKINVSRKLAEDEYAYAHVNDVEIYNGKAYVTIPGTVFNPENRITVINITTDEIIKNITIGICPRILDIKNDHGYITNCNNSVSVIDTVNDNLITIINNESFDQPYDIFIDNNKVYVSNTGGGSYGSLSIIDTNTNKVIKVIDLKPSPYAVAVTNGKLYVANNDGYEGYINVINLTNYNLIKNISIDAPGSVEDYQGMRMFVKDNKIYITNDEGAVSVIDTVNDNLITNIDVGLHLGSSHYSDIEGVDDKVYTTDSFDVDIINTTADTRIGNITNIDPVGIALTKIQLIQPSGYKLLKGWNLISLPIQEVSDKNTLFPTAISNAFTYYSNQGYKIENTLIPGKGYWLKFPDSVFIDINGTKIINLNVNVTEGWNMIGSLSEPIETSKITSDPPNIIPSNYFGYENSYVVVDKLIPGKGYWVKVNQSGTLTLKNSNNNELQKNIDLSEFNTLNINSLDNNANLYFGITNQKINEDRIKLPPKSNNFDARFKENKFIEILPNNLNTNLNYDINIQNEDYPIKIIWNLKQQDYNYILNVKTNKQTYNKEIFNEAKLIINEPLESLSLTVIPKTIISNPGSFTGSSSGSSNNGGGKSANSDQETNNIISNDNPKIKENSNDPLPKISAQNNKQDINNQESNLITGYNVNQKVPSYLIGSTISLLIILFGLIVTILIRRNK